ncbi:MAG TPA: IS21-like element helper ATPase IstB [Candidatus Ozemobacteraceae bacterium]|nr:IS21-like element helper ATPase IstB [Candidatus Ozemobacteraceae bacterium]
MLNHATRDKLLNLKLIGMARGWEHQTADPGFASLSFDERLGLLVDAEVTEQANRRLVTRLKTAQLRQSATLEDMNWRSARGLDRSAVMALADGEWIRRHQNVLVTGPTGAGKSYLACALGHSACRNGLTVRYWRLPRLWDEFYLARLENRWGRFLTSLSRFDLLILDDLGMCAMTDQSRQDLLELLDDRYDRRATIIVSQIPFANWHEAIGEPTMADAILDRLVHTSHKITMKGDSMRKTTKNNTMSATTTENT